MAVLGCGIAAADTIIAGAIDTSHGEYSVWIKEDGLNSTTYFANAIEMEIASNHIPLSRGVLSIDLFTDISFDAPNGARVPLASQTGFASTATVLDRIASTLPLIASALPSNEAAAAPAPTATKRNGPELASLSPRQGLRARGRQSE